MGSIANWRAREHTEHKELWDFGIAPVLRLQRSTEGTVPYLEASLGVHLLSKRHINGNREFSTAFQFGEFVGAGLLFGARQNVGLGLRLQHVSNGGIKNPNPGLSFASVSAGGGHTCALTTARVAYCWGVNTGSNVPVKVAYQP